MRPLSERADALNEQHLYKKTKTKKTNGHKKGQNHVTPRAFRTKISVLSTGEKGLYESIG